MTKLLSFTKISVLSILLTSITPTFADTLGPNEAFTTRYWDCCKPSCAWADKGNFIGNKPVGSCDANNAPILDAQTGTGCNGGTAFSCANQVPWAVNETFSYGFVGAFLKGGDEKSWCCSCYELEFLDGPIKGNKMVVQASNTDYELPNENIFTFGIPAGNTSYAYACAIQYGVPNSTFGTEWEGIATQDQCNGLPEVLKKGCNWRWDWFKDAKYPKVSYKRVQCPKVLTDITGCSRADDAALAANATKSGAASVLNTPSATSIGIMTMFSTVIGVLLTSWAGFL